MNQNNQNNSINTNELNQKVQDVLNKYKTKEEEIQRQLYELEAQQKILEQNLTQQSKALSQTFGTDDIDKIKEIQDKYEKSLNEMIQKLNQY